MNKKRYYPPQPERVAKICYVCGSKLLKDDVKIRRDGYCKECRSEQALLARLRHQTDAQLKKTRAKYKRYITLYNEVLEERLLARRKEIQDEMQEKQL